MSGVGVPRRASFATIDAHGSFHEHELHSLPHLLRLHPRPLSQHHLLASHGHSYLSHLHSLLSVVPSFGAFYPISQAITMPGSSILSCSIIPSNSSLSCICLRSTLLSPSILVHRLVVAHKQTTS